MKRKLSPKYSIRRIFILLVCTVLPVFLPSSVAFAHANLVQSDPERGATLAQAPKSIKLEFSEALDPQLSQVQLLDSHGQEIVKGPGVIDSANPRIMHLDLPKLSNGSYSAVWQTHSAADGHFANGTVSFSVGTSSAAFSLLPAENTSLPTETVPTLPDILIRWAGYLAAALLGGAVFFASLVWSPAYRAAPEPNPQNDQLAGRLLKRQLLISAGLLIVITILGVVYQAITAVASGAQASFWPVLLGLFSFTSSWQLWLRIIVLAVSIVFTLQLSPPGHKFPLDWLVMVPFVIIVFATFSLKSHAAGLNDPLAVASDVVHLTAMSAWFGGLLPLFVLLRRTDLEPGLLVPRFSRVALASVSILALTGLYNGVVQVHTLDALTSTSYGLTLIAKMAIFGVLVGLGALNFLVLTPRFRKDAPKATRQMRISIRFELLLGICLLAAVGILTGASPSYEAVQAKRQMGVVGEYAQDRIQMRLWLAPGITGVNEVA
jgi:copper transport protein